MTGVDCRTGGPRECVGVLPMTTSYESCFELGDGAVGFKLELEKELGRDDLSSLFCGHGPGLDDAPGLTLNDIVQLGGYSVIDLGGLDRSLSLRDRHVRCLLDHQCEGLLF